MKVNKYEGMFLFDAAVATDWDAIQAELNRLIERARAKVIASGKWDERRLAYEIRGCKRGVYVLVYFEAEPDKITGIERDVQLSESLVRCLVIRADHLNEEQMKQATTSPSYGAAPEPSAGMPHHRDVRGSRGAATAVTAPEDEPRVPDAVFDEIPRADFDGPEE